MNRPVVRRGLAFLGWLAYALARWQIWAKGHLILFTMAGHTDTPSPTPSSRPAS